MARFSHNPSMVDLPIACSLSPAALKARRENLLNVLWDRADERYELSNGYRLRFSMHSDILDSIARTIDAERQCWRFLCFTLTIEPADGGIVLDLTGPPGTREFLVAMLDET
jgi:hypothetical protein